MLSLVVLAVLWQPKRHQRCLRQGVVQAGDFAMQGLHVAVNEKKSLPVVIETKNVPVSTGQIVLPNLWHLARDHSQ